MEITKYQNLEVLRLKVAIEDAEEELAELESRYSNYKSEIDYLRKDIIANLREYFIRLDKIKILIKYQKEYISKLSHKENIDSDKIKNEFFNDSNKADSKYDQNDNDNRRDLNDQDREELKILWKKLVKLYHPDLVQNDKDKYETFHLLIQAINTAKENGDIETLRTIADDPYLFIKSKGWNTISLDEDDNIEVLKKRLSLLLGKIQNSKDEITLLLKSSDYDLLKKCKHDPKLMDNLIISQKEHLVNEISHLVIESKLLSDEIIRISDIPNPPFVETVI
jgi:DNA polymerase-3 subunit epsilon